MSLIDFDKYRNFVKFKKVSRSMRYDSPFPEHLLPKRQRVLDMTITSSNVFVYVYLLLLKTPKPAVDVLVMLLME